MSLRAQTKAAGLNVKGNTRHGERVLEGTKIGDRLRDAAGLRAALRSIVRA